ncbi:unnamed protein product [Echinostoma caproni]|uniref:Bromo domain-containing protein n=1 Tax=Echinostoma caproni TaxID=27848 RepID=A0A183AG52_9TREM|nr:unnamed protein product [Echinostoma caproni]
MYANSDSESPQSPEQVARIQLRKARKVLAERRNSKPSICVPVVPRAKIEIMAARLENVSGDVMSFLQKAYVFWKLKREFRRGVPLLKRLQAGSAHRSAANFAASVDTEAQQMRAQLKFWQQLRQDLEKARLLAELIRKRERVKRDMFRLFMDEIELQIQPMDTFLLRILEQLQVLDKQNFFAEPVGPNLAPDYHLIIKQPMDFSTMRKKIEDSLYLDIASFEADFHLMIDNCFQYNHEDSVYCVAASHIAEHAKKIFSEAHAIARTTGLCLKSGILYLDNKDISDLKLSPPSATEDNTTQVKENYLSPISVEPTPLSEMERTKPTESSVLDTNTIVPSEPIQIHLPLKELANGPVASTTRSRLRITGPVHELIARRGTLRASNGHLNASENAFRQSRKRRVPSGSPNKKRLSESIRPAKQERLDGSHASKNLLYWHSQTKGPDLFSPGVPVSTTITTNIRTNGTTIDHTVGAKWASSDQNETSNWMLGRHSDTVRPRSGLQFSSAAVESDQSTAPLVRKSPAFTHYRLSRPSRGEDEDDEDDDEEEEDEDDDDETEDSEDPDTGNHSVHKDENNPNNPISLSTTTNPDQTSPSRVTRKHCRGRPALTSAGRSSLVVTTIVGNSRMATAIRRGDRARLHRKTTAPRGRSCKPVLHRQRARSTVFKSERKLLRRVSSSSSNSAPQQNSLPVDDDLRKPLQLRELTTSSLTPDLSDVLSHIESPGPLSATTSLEPYEFSNHSTDMALSTTESPTTRGRTGDPPYEHQFGPLDVVWAKCRGSPWYPALVVDPGAHEGYCHNGVPVPVPPESVLWGKRLNANIQSDQDKPDLLVLFFDTKRTWQWLSHHKLQLLGTDSELDRERLKEGKRSKLKHSVLKAYRRAVEHLCKVHGKPYPYVDSRSSHDLAVFTL